ncbi:hypothetical protein STCU_08353 [Strigomonas culicis]|uniref:Peptide chain release factor 1 n=1 Tax=Strigomonas culicis TaxID=28005 RepID=S9TUK5_9TRYP|nr:hypothetical protein STCU_08353 [Strigomonas culicis]|eukprot:EPY22087.1 hypothetical protein STCU_08353 [Strigomonas culicis]
MWCRKVGRCAALTMTTAWSRSVHAEAATDTRGHNKRYSAANRTGRSVRIREILTTMKSSSKVEAKKVFAALPPREKLDVVRALATRRRCRRRDRHSKLPKYRSAEFERAYFFKEDDVIEESTLGRGPGGQATNRRMQTVILRHTPSRLIVKFSRFPSLWLNRRAARELLHWRLEEHYLGPLSTLGHRKQLAMRRQRRHNRTMTYLEKKGASLQKREQHQPYVYAFQKGERALPPVGEVGASPLYIYTIFGSECRNLWTILNGAFTATDPRTSPDTVAPPPCPLLVRYMFPVSHRHEDDLSKISEEEFSRCCADNEVKQNVKRAFLCMVELFGLCCHEVQDKKGRPRALLVEDGLNWIERKERMYGQDCHLTPLAVVLWKRAYQSLSDLGISPQERVDSVVL